MTSHRLPPGRSWPPADLGKAARRVAEALRTGGPNTRSRLMILTGLSRPTVSSALAELTERDLIDAHSDDDHASSRPRADRADAAGRTIGRPAEVIRLSRRAGIAIGVDVGRRHIRVVLADLGHQLIARASAGLDEGADTQPRRVLDTAAELVQGVLTDAGAHLAEVVGVALGIPAPITRDGTMGSATLLPAWAHLDLGCELTARLGEATVFVDNDASLGALGEYVFGGGQGSREMTYLKVATGIGAGIVRDGRLQRGAAGTGGELGHITLDMTGEMCPCGNRGCLELYAGGAALLRKASTYHHDLTDLGDLIDRAQAGDQLCRTLIAEAGDFLGVALGNLININSPDRIVMGGELLEAGDILLAPLRARLSRTAMAPAVDAVTIAQARLKSWEHAWGGVALILKAPC